MRTKIKQYFNKFIGSQGIAYFRITISITLALLTAGVVAVSVDTLTTFTTGTTAKASEVNANFAALNKAVTGIPSWTKTGNGTGTDVYFTDGNVGIGTSSPTTALEVKGILSFQDVSGKSFNAGIKSNVASALIDLGINDGSNNRFGGSYTQANQGGFLRFETRSIAPLFQIFGRTAGTASSDGISLVSVTSAGNVGIGTTNPEVPLTFAATAGQKIKLYTNSTVGNEYSLGVEAAELRISSALSSFISFYTNGYSGNERMRITSAGAVGIGITSPAYTLHVNGGIAGYQAYANLSDLRYKKNIQTIQSPMDKILKLRGVNYEWRQNEFKDMKFKSGKDIGFIGQEVEKVLPEAVNKDSKGFISLAYSNIIPVLVEAFKELKSNNDSSLKALKEENAELSSRYASLLDDHNLLKLELRTHSRASLRLEQENDLLKKTFR